ncbi:unnamed protein product [Microthlaspi erraticum]|uniref:Uncharacterized protein n=1 Tax=Microthlaspi erraticum TaxID=1685480 RepID=A0A6D2IJ06_9BRAS|nr:unnamed protein product [Microthlaspi erraticum]
MDKLRRCDCAGFSRVEVECGISAPPSDVVLWSLLWEVVAEVSVRSERCGGSEALRTSFRRRFVQGGGVFGCFDLVRAATAWSPVYRRVAHSVVSLVPFSPAAVVGRWSTVVGSHSDDCGFSAQIWPSVWLFQLLLVPFASRVRRLAQALIGDDSVKA